MAQKKCPSSPRVCPFLNVKLWPLRLSLSYDHTRRDVSVSVISVDLCRLSCPVSGYSSRDPLSSPGPDASLRPIFLLRVIRLRNRCFPTPARGLVLQAVQEITP